MSVLLLIITSFESRHVLLIVSLKWFWGDEIGVNRFAQLVSEASSLLSSYNGITKLYGTLYLFGIEVVDHLSRIIVVGCRGVDIDQVERSLFRRLDPNRVALRKKGDQ